MISRVDLAGLSQAERLLWGYGVTEPQHIDLLGIANDRNAEVVYRPMEGCEARLLVCGERALISVNNRSSVGRQNFSLAHELAHWIRDREKGSFLCAQDDIGPQNAEAMSTEASANSFASQLLLPDYLVETWVQKKACSLDVASALAEDFHASLTAATLKLSRKSAQASCVLCHRSGKLLWFRKNRTFPSDISVLNQLHHETDAFAVSFEASTGLTRPKRERGSRWFYGNDFYLPEVQSQSIRYRDGRVLTLISVFNH